MSRAPRSTGAAWEDFAARAISAAGLQILERGYQCRLGEIDVIALEHDTLVFIEVRFRRNDRYGDAAASVTPAKQQRIINAARHYLMSHPGFSEYPVRLDVIAFSRGASAAQAPDFRWIRNAFAAH